MQDPKNNTVPSSEQQALPTTVPYSHYLYSGTNNFRADSNRGPYGIMPHNMFPVNQWQQADGYQHASNMTGNLTTTASSDLTSTLSTITNNIPIMSVNTALVASPNLNAGPNCNSGANAIPPFFKTYKNPKFCFPMNEMENQKVTLSTCELYPPNPCQAQSESNFIRGTNEVFIRGFPENTTDAVVKEIFKKYGKIVTVEKKNNFYVVTYEFGYLKNIDEAWFLNGWQIKIENDDSDESCTGILSIFFDEKDATAKGCVPPPPYSDKEILQLLPQLANDDHFSDALAILTAWLERGECHKRNVSHFYSAIQKTNSHVTNLIYKKTDLEHNVHKAREELNDKIRSILAQLKEFKKVLEMTLLQKVWDHMTKPQRKCIQFWMKEISDLQLECSKELLCDRVEDEMEMSDEEALRSSNEDEFDEADELYALKQNLENELQSAEQEMKKINTEKEDTVKNLRCNIQNKCEVPRRTARKSAANTSVDSPPLTPRKATARKSTGASVTAPNTPTNHFTRSSTQNSTVQVSRQSFPSTSYDVSKSRPSRVTQRNSSVNSTPQDSSDEELGGNDLENLVNKCVSYILVADQKKCSIKKQDIIKHVFDKSNSKSYKTVIDKACQILKKTFGLEILNIENKKNEYLLVNILDRELGTRDFAEYTPSQLQKQGLIFYLLTIIYMNENVISEDELWKALEPLGIDVNSRTPHAIFGDVKKYITKDLVNQMYLEYRCICKDPVQCEFVWGQRAKQEVGKEDLLKFACKVMGDTEPKDWVFQHNDATQNARDEE